MTKRRMIWLYGAVGWGLPVGVLWAVVMTWLRGSDRGFLLVALAHLATLPLWVLGGCAWGYCMWWWMSRRGAGK